MMGLVPIVGSSSLAGRVQTTSRMSRRPNRMKETFVLAVVPTSGVVIQPVLTVVSFSVPAAGRRLAILMNSALVVD